MHDWFYFYVVLVNLVPPVAPAMVMFPVTQPLGDGNLRSINEQAELTSSVPVGEERVNIVEERRNVTTEERRFHGKVCLSYIRSISSLYSHGESTVINVVYIKCCSYCVI